MNWWRILAEFAMLGVIVGILAWIHVTQEHGEIAVPIFLVAGLMMFSRFYLEGGDS